MSSVAHQAGVGRRGKLWFGLLGGAVAWLVHLMLAYAIAEFGCVSRLGHVLFLGISVVAWLLLALTAVTTVVGVVATWVGYRLDRRLHPGDERELEPGAGREFVATAGWVASGLFTATIVVESIPIFFYLQRC